MYATSMTSSSSTKQPRCILIFQGPGHPDRDGSAEASTSDLNHAGNLHKLAQTGCSTYVAYRDGPRGNPLLALQQLLGVELDHSMAASKKSLHTGSYLQVRFRDLQVGFVSNCSAACELAEQAGCDLLATPHDSGNILGFCGNEPHVQWPAAKSMAQSLLATLGDSSCTNAPTPSTHGAAQAKKHVLLLVYLNQQNPDLGCSSEARSSTQQASEPQTGSDAIDKTRTGQSQHGQQSLYSWLDGLAGYLCAEAVEKQLLLVFMLSDMPGCSTALPQRQQLVHASGDFPLVPQPLQSHRICSMRQVTPHPSQSSLMVQYLPGVVRQDMVQKLSLSEVRLQGGGGCILAEQILPELAYKLGKAPKYGA